MCKLLSEFTRRSYVSVSGSDKIISGEMASATIVPPLREPSLDLDDDKDEDGDGQPGKLHRFLVNRIGNQNRKRANG